MYVTDTATSPGKPTQNPQPINQCKYYIIKNRYKVIAQGI
jgi:hypothetical protein